MSAADQPVPPVECPEVILNAASAELIAHGYRSASVDRIAALARVSKRTLYRHFASKAEMLEASIEHALETARQAVPPPPVSPDRAATLARFAEWVRDVCARPEMLGLYRVSIELARQMPPLAEHIHRRWRDRQGPLRDALDRLARSGVLRFPDLGLAQTQFGFLAIRGLSDHVRLPRQDGRAEQAWNEGVAALFLEGQGRRQGAADPPIDPPRLPDARSEDDLFLRWRAGGMRLRRDQFDRVLDACAEEFLERGFRDASLQPVAVATRVSRMTLLRQFGAKAELFGIAIERYARRLYRPGAALPLRGAFRTALEQTAAELHRRFRAPDNIRLLRLMVAESARFPELSAAVYRLSRDAALHELAVALEDAARAGCIGQERIALAPEQFHLLAIQGNEALFSGGEGAGWLSGTTRSEHIVRLFLEGYR